MIAIICTDGQLSHKDIQRECIKQKWIPLLTLKSQEKTILPVFNLADIAYKFVVRNLPKEWKHGCVHLTNDDIATIIKKNWTIQPMDFPRKIKDNPEFEMSFEIHEFTEEPDYRMG